jgi:thioredoxin reductase
MGKTAEELRAYIDGIDPISGRPVMQEIVEGLTRPFDAEDRRDASFTRDSPRLVEPGGHLANVAGIEDFPGFPEGVAGYELGPNAQQQAAAAGADFALAEVTGLEPSGAGWSTATGQERYQASCVIVAVGSRPAPLGLAGEEALFGRGLSHCATCDGPLFRG